MKKFLMVLGGAALVTVLVVAIALAYFSYVGSKFDESSKTFVDQSVPAIVAAWSKEELIKRAAPELLAIANEEQVGRLFAQLSRLGKLERYVGSKGQANIVLTIKARTVVTASYVARAVFEKGPIEVNIKLIHRDGRWQIASFYVDSPMLIL